MAHGRHNSVTVELKNGKEVTKVPYLYSRICYDEDTFSC